MEPIEVRNNFIIGLAVQLFLTDPLTEIARPWAQLWPDEQEPYLKRANEITDHLIRSGYILEFRN